MNITDEPCDLNQKQKKEDEEKTNSKTKCPADISMKNEDLLGGLATYRVDQDFFLVLGEGK